ncbi:hypothetical protein AB0H00_19730 [Nocardia sp. NPDC023852]|uniref:hypothetical protein n=1 Tax=Nocardia sp. NPDC023852 TaxID=3154697 RepID=UPI0033EAAAD3
MSASTSAEGVPDRRSRPHRVLLVGGVVIAAIVWLVWPNLPGPLVLNTGTSHHLVTVTIDSLRVGHSDIDIDITDRAGAPIGHAAVRIQADQPLMGYAGQPVAAVPAGGHRFHVAALPLMMTGPWELRLSIEAHDGVDQLTLPIWVGG